MARAFKIDVWLQTETQASLELKKESVTTEPDQHSASDSHTDQRIMKHAWILTQQMHGECAHTNTHAHAHTPTHTHSLSGEDQVSFCVQWLIKH